MRIASGAVKFKEYLIKNQKRRSRAIRVSFPSDKDNLRPYSGLISIWEDLATGHGFPSFSMTSVGDASENPMIFATYV